MTENRDNQTLVENTEIGIGNIEDAAGIAVGAGATAVHVDALGDIGDVITGTKISLVNQAATQRVASKHQVSPPSAGYIAREGAEKELEKLLTADYDGFHTVYLYGLPGAGKSWLARKVAASLEKNFVDGILGADLLTADMRTAVWKFIEPYDETISRTSLTSANEFTAAMQSAFGDRRILVVLDHLQAWGNDWQELRSWLPARCQNCVMLLIAHQQPPRLHDNESSLRLSGMTPEEAVHMFTRLLSDDGEEPECDEETMLALSEKLDYVPGAISAVARDINVKLLSPGEYLEALDARRDENGATQHMLSLEKVYQNLPPEGQHLFPFLGILRKVPWTADDLFAITPKTSRHIDVGLAQLTRAGIVDCLDLDSYLTPLTISDFALHKLRELGGKPLVEAAMTLRSADILRKVEIILRYARQSILCACWQNNDTREIMMQSVSRQFSSRVAREIRKSEETNLFAIQLDPLEDFFEDYALTHQPYVRDWLRMLQASSFPAIRRQLEEVFDWAVGQEDWPLVRRFASRVDVNSSWIINSQLDGKDEDNNWTRFDYAFSLLKDITANGVEMMGVNLKGSHVKSTRWKECQFVDMAWRGTHMVSSTFYDVDMVGMVMPASVITGCTFVNVDARYGDFRGTIFQQCRFVNVNFRAAQFENAKFIDCYFSNVDFRLTVIEDSFAKVS